MPDLVSDEWLLSTQELADYLSVGVSTIHEWNSKEIGPKKIKMGKFVRYRMSDVRDWLESKEVK